MPVTTAHLIVRGWEKKNLRISKTKKSKTNPAHACTQVHRFSQHSPADSAYLCETDVSKYVWQQRWCFRTRSFPAAPILAHACTQVHRFSEHRPADSTYLCETDVCKYVWQQEWRNPVYARRINSSALVFKSFITPILIYKFCLYLSLSWFIIKHEPSVWEARKSLSL